MTLALILSAVLAATPATLPAQLKAAQAGDVVTVDASAPCGPVSLQGVQFSAPVTVDFGQAKCGYLLIANVKNLRVKGGSFARSDWHGGIYVGAGADGVTLDGVSSPGGSTAFTGVTIRGATNVTLQNSTLTGGVTGLSVLQAANVTILANDFSGQVGDAINLSASQHVRVLWNRIHDNVESPIHPDGVQMYSPAGYAPLADIEVAYNVIQGPVQGINNFGNVATPLDGLYVHDNLIRTSYPQGIAFAWWQMTNGRVERNRTETIPGATWQTMIRLPAATDPPSVTACGNVIDGRAIGVPCAR